MSTESESLRGSETPSFTFILKWLGIIFGLAVAALVGVGLLLPREWRVELSVEIEAEPAVIHALVEDATRWDEWMFDPDQDATNTQLEAEGRGVGASVRWTSEGSKGQMVLVEADPEVGIAWDGLIETDEINNHGTIRYEPLEGGRVRVTLIDEGTLPPIVGGYFVPVMNAGLTTHFDAALTRLEHVAENN